MSGKEINQIAKILNSGNSNEIYKILKLIRKDYARDYNKMMELAKKCAIKSIIVSFLEHPKFCNISLSIIADACVEIKFLNGVIKNEGVKSLIRIMKSNVCEEIRNRACRALGNIAKCTSGFVAVHEGRPVSDIIAFLANTSNVNCQKTAIRTLIILGKTHEGQELISRNHGIAEIIHVMVVTRKTEIDLCCIKALANLAGQRVPESCLLELETINYILGYHDYSDEVVRKHVLLILKCLSFDKKGRYNLMKTDAIKIIMEIALNGQLHEMRLTATLVLTNCIDLIYSSRNTLGKSILQTLLSILKSNSYREAHEHIIISIEPLFTDDGLQDVFLSLNFVETLTKHLRRYIKRNISNHAVIVKTINKGYSSPLVNQENNILSSKVETCDKVHVSKKIRLDNIESTSSVNEPPLLKNLFLSNIGSDEFILISDSADPYSVSPVTTVLSSSSPQTNTEPNHAFQTNTCSDDLIRSSNYHNKFSVLNVKNIIKDRKVRSQRRDRTIDDPILFMILQLTHFWKKMEQSPLASNAFFSVLMDYVRTVPSPDDKAKLALIALFQNYYTFQNIITNGFVDELDERLTCPHDPKYCAPCSHIHNIHTQLLEAGRAVALRLFPRAVLCHILSAYDDAIKIRIIFAISKLIQDKYSLFKILIKEDALSLIIDFLNGNSEAIQLKSLVSICGIYETLNISVKQKIKEVSSGGLGHGKQSVTLRYQDFGLDTFVTCHYQDFVLDTTFVLDDGIEINASKKRLCETSSYFRALLTGGFVEGKQDTIRLTQISSAALNAILHFLHGCYPRVNCKFIKILTLETAFELLAKCEEFMLFTFKDYVEKQLHAFLTPCNVALIYHSAKMQNLPNLCNKAVKYILTMYKWNKSELHRSFKQILCPEFLGDLRCCIESCFEYGTHSNTVQVK